MPSTQQAEGGSRSQKTSGIYKSIVSMAAANAPAVPSGAATALCSTCCLLHCLLHTTAPISSNSGQQQALSISATGLLTCLLHPYIGGSCSLFNLHPASSYLHSQPTHSKFLMQPPSKKLSNFPPFLFALQP
jgi:hypothetical protein